MRDSVINLTGSIITVIHSHKIGCQPRPVRHLDTIGLGIRILYIQIVSVELHVYLRTQQVFSTLNLDSDFDGLAHSK